MFPLSIYKSVIDVEGEEPMRQGAMEYLMTYGLAIFAIIAVILALAYLGFFSGGSPLGTTCLPLSGYFCQNPVYSNATGNLSFTFGESTGNPWPNAYLAFVNQTQESSVVSNGLGPSIPLVQIPGGLISGQLTAVTLPVSGPVKKGAARSGYIWAGYTTALRGPVSYVQVATATLKAA